MNTIASRSPHQIACDGIQTVWLPSTPPARETFEVPALRSMAGIVFRGTVGDVATHLLRRDFKQAAVTKQRPTLAEDSFASLIATMDGIRSRRPVTVAA